MHTKLFRIWAKALGEKASERKAEADMIALVRNAVTKLNSIRSPTPLAVYRKRNYSVYTLLHCHA